MALQYPSSSSSLHRLITILCFIFLNFLFYSSSPSLQVSSISTFSPTTSPMIVQQGKEALALLTWKSNLHIQSQSFLSSWFGASPCNHWFGVTCHKSGSVSGLNLQSCGLKGTLHNLNFLSLPNLLTLDLYNNSFYGTIPIHNGNLSKMMTILDLGSNYFIGLIPHQVGLLTSLISLTLASNHLRGSIPPIIGNLRNLTTLNLYENELSGSIPHEVGLLRSLNCLALYTNNLSGPIPPSIGNLRNLTTLYLYENKLSGSIPHEIGSLTSLNDLELSHPAFHRKLKEFNRFVSLWKQAFWFHPS